MTGKEALNLLFYTSEGLPEDKVYECKKILEKELEYLTKYKRAFEILKDSELIHFFKYEETDIYEIITGDGTQILTEEEYELLEEVLGNENNTRI